MARPHITVGVDARELTQLYRDLDAADKDIARDFLADVKKGGEAVRSDASSAASAFSKRIPGTIRLVSAGGRGKVRVAIRAGGKGAPNAAPLENLGKSGTFRHPVFGNRRNWVEQEAHPFLLPALRKNLDKVAASVADSVDKALKARRL